MASQCVQLSPRERAIIAESARWGDARRSNPYTRDVDWQRERNRLLTQYFPQRTEILLSQLKEVGLYPDIGAPAFSINGLHQHGGSIHSGDALSMTAATSAGADRRKRRICDSGTARRCQKTEQAFELTSDWLSVTKG